MFTVCPKCTLTLVVTTVDLRAGQGYVRCGRCANVFNALIALREGDPGGSTSDTANRRLQETAPRPPAEPALGAGVAMDPEPEPEPQPEPASEPPLDIQAGESTEEPSLEFDAISTDVSEIFIAPPETEPGTGSGSFEEIVLAEEADVPAEFAAGAEPEAEAEAEPEPVADDPSHTDTIAGGDWSLLDDDEPPADDESVIEESPLVVADEEQTTEQQFADPPWVEQMFAEAEAGAEPLTDTDTEEESGRTPAPEHEVSAPDEPDEAAMVQAARDSTGAAAPTDTVLEPLLGQPAPARPRWPYVTGITVLSLLLLIQIVHFNRQSLVLSQSVGPLLSKFYSVLNVTLVPRWDLTAYNVKQLGAQAEGGEGTRLRVRLSLQNESTRVQPLPLLRLTLQDVYGKAVATRDLEPREYLPPAAHELRLLEPDQRIDAELQVIDPGHAAIGFEIDACLRAEGGSIGCANDARRRAD